MRGHRVDVSHNGGRIGNHRINLFQQKAGEFGVEHHPVEPVGFGNVVAFGLVVESHIVLAAEAHCQAAQTAFVAKRIAAKGKVEIPNRAHPDDAVRHNVAEAACEHIAIVILA